MNKRMQTPWALRVLVAFALATILTLPAVGDEPKPGEKTEKAAPPQARPGVREPTIVLKPGELPAAEFETLVYDFGKARAGTEVIHEYKFKNTGNGPLEILGVKPGCGCTTAGAHTEVVQPGESGVIPIKLKPGNTAGPVNKRITVTTNIPDKGKIITLEIKGTVWSPVQVTPRSAAFGRLTPDTLKTGMTRTLTIVNNLEEPMNPGAIRSSNDAFGGEIKPVEAGKKYELIVSITDRIVGGSNSTQLTFETGLEDPKTIDVPAYVFLSPPVDITPSKLQLPTPRTADLVRTFYIRSNTANTIDVTEVKSSSDKLTLELSDVRGDKRTYRLEVTIPPDYAPPAGGDEITFKTSDPSVPVGSIPVLGTFSKESESESTNMTPVQ